MENFIFVQWKSWQIGQFWMKKVAIPQFLLFIENCQAYHCLIQNCLESCFLNKKYLV